ncbi:MAG: hypothetical protein ABII68_06090 [Pseudomonadota bacterium]
MKGPLTWTLLLFLTGILCLSTRPVFAGWEWKDKLTLNFDAPVLDVSEVPDGTMLFILTPKEVLLYSVPGKKIEKRIPLDKTYDNLIHSPGNNTLILTSRSEKALKIIQLEIVYAINTSELPFLGSKNAPVTLVVFSDYQ